MSRPDWFEETPPPTPNDVEAMREHQRKRLRGDRLAELLKEFPPAHQCPKCGGAMAHFRLKGYRCSRCD